MLRRVKDGVRWRHDVEVDVGVDADISFRSSEGGRTVVELWGNGSWPYREYSTIISEYYYYQFEGVLSLKSLLLFPAGVETFC